MKKIFSFIIALVFAMSFTFGQSLTLTYGTTGIDSGDTLEVVVPQLNVQTDFYLDVTNVTEGDVMVRVYKNELYMLDGANASLCFGGLCYPPSTMESSVVTIPAQTTISHTSDPEQAFHLSYKTPVAGTSYVEFVFANEDNDDDQTSVVFKLVYDPTSIVSTAVATKMNAYPNPASEMVTIEYAVTGSSNNVNLVIKNLVGATVLTKRLDTHNNKLKLDVSDYNAGIYFYSIETDGRPLITKKLLVK